MLALLLIIGCKNADVAPVPALDAPVWLDDVDYLNRASIALRGVRPSVDDLAAVQADPAAVEAIVEGYVRSPEFLLVMRDLHAEMLLVRTDSTPQLPALGPLEGYDRGDMYESVTLEPLKLVEHVIANDLPYTEVVTADYTVVDAIGAAVFGLPYDPAGPEWQVIDWHDGRPGAGVLSTGAMMIRHESGASNYHRGRAAMLASTFLCSGFEDRDVPLSGEIDIADHASVADALMTDPSCINCHQSLDPLSAYFWGFRGTIHPQEVSEGYRLGCSWSYATSILPVFSAENPPSRYCYPVHQYTPSDEGEWATWGLRPPSYYGTPAADLGEVGDLVAEDPRFAQCIATRFYSWLTQIAQEDVPLEVAVELQASFVASGYDARALALAVATHSSFRSAGHTDPAAQLPTDTLRVTRPEQVARMIEDLTGYRWWVALNPPGCESNARYGNICWGDVDLMTTDTTGFRAMSGGIDGYYVVRPVHAVTPVKLLAMGQLAYDAAGFVVDADLANPDPGARRLLQLVEAGTTDETTIRAQLAWLFLRVLGRPTDPTSAEVDAAWELFDGVRQATGDPVVAWKTTLGALLQDPRMLVY